jgi:competence protein ComEC
LKVSHHGSKYATSEEFLQAVSPNEAVISVGKNNSYGHPAPEVIERLLKSGARIWRTDAMGDIKYDCANPQAQCAIAN